MIFDIFKLFNDVKLLKILIECSIALKLKLDISNDNKLHPSNIEFIFLTEEVLKLVKFKFSNFGQLKNILVIFSTLSVLKFVKSKEINSQQFENIYSILLTFDVSKLDKFNEIIVFKSENKYDISEIFVFTLDKFKYFNEGKSLNISFEKKIFVKSKLDRSNDIKELHP